MIKLNSFLILLLGLIIVSCNNDNESYKLHTSTDTIINGYVVDINKAKYTKVLVDFEYKGTMYRIDNDVQGHYYREYPFNVGDSIQLPINIKYYIKNKDINMKQNITYYKLEFNPNFKVFN